MSRPMDELQQLLKNLHLSRMAEGLPEELQRAEKEGLAYTELLLRLVRAQWHHRQETALEWRIRQARLPERWALVRVSVHRDHLDRSIVITGIGGS